MKYQVVIGLEVPSNSLPIPKFSAAVHTLRRGAQLPDLSGLSRPSGRFAGAEQKGGGIRYPGRACH